MSKNGDCGRLGKKGSGRGGRREGAKEGAGVAGQITDRSSRQVGIRDEGRDS